MALRASNADEDARCGRTLWSFLVVCGRRAWRFRGFFPVSFNRVPMARGGPPKVMKARRLAAMESITWAASSRDCPMALRTGKADEDARGGRTLWSFLVVCGRRGLAFSLFLPRVFNRVPHGPRRATKGNEGAAARGDGINNLGCVFKGAEGLCVTSGTPLAHGRGSVRKPLAEPAIVFRGGACFPLPGSRMLFRSHAKMSGWTPGELDRRKIPISIAGSTHGF
jgi:hypothetical protein